MIDFPITKSNSTNYFIGEIELGNMKKPFGLIAQLFISHTDIVSLSKWRTHLLLSVSILKSKNVVIYLNVAEMQNEHTRNKTRQLSQSSTQDGKVIISLDSNNLNHFCDVDQNNML